MVKTFAIPIRKEVLQLIEQKFNHQKKLPYDYQWKVKGQSYSKTVNLNFDCVIYLIYYLVKLIEKEDEAFYLNSTILKNNFINEYKPYIDFLENNDIIVLASNYSVGSNSKLYGFGHTYNHTKKQYILYEITNKNLLNKIANPNKGPQLIIKQNIEQCHKRRKHLVKHFDNHLQIDLPSALNHISILKDKAYDYNVMSVYKFDLKNWTYSIAQNDNRLHTQLTSLNKQLLKYITYKNQSLAEVDFKSSQPLFLYIVLKTIFEDCSHHKVSDYLNKLIGKTLISKMKSFPLDINELNTFGNIILNEDIYLFSIENIKEIKRENERYFYFDKSKSIWTKEYFDTKRDLMKTIVMRSLYGGKGEEITQFKALFPSIFALINVINNHKKLSDSKNNLSHILQSIEAFVILDLIAKDVSKSFKNIPLFSKHDSIITYGSSIDDVYKFVIQRFDYYIGIKSNKIIAKSHWT